MNASPSNVSLAGAGRALLCIAAAAMAAGGCGQKKDGGPPRGPQAIVVEQARPTTQTIRRSVDVVGTLYGLEETTISAKVPGRVESIFQDVGDAVPAGSPLLQIEPRDYLLVLEQKKLAVRDPLAKLGLRAPPDASFKPENVATVRRAKLQADNAQSRFERVEKLFRDAPPRVSEQDYTDARTALEVARSNHEVELLTVGSLLAQVEERTAELHVAQQRLADATIRAPVQEPGAATRPAAQTAATVYHVAARLVSVGEYVREGTPLFRLVDDSVVKLRAAVPERYARDVRTGQSVSVEVAAYPDEKFLGQVSRINPQVDQASRTFGVEILVPNRDRKLKSGAFARASIEVRVDHGVLCVPQESIVSFAGEQKVFRVADGKAVQYGIETGEHLQLRRGDRVEEWVEVRSGLAGLDPVVVSGMSKLATGVAVTVRRPETRPASRSPSGPADAP